MQENEEPIDQHKKREQKHLHLQLNPEFDSLQQVQCSQYLYRTTISLFAQKTLISSERERESEHDFS